MRVFSCHEPRSSGDVQEITDRLYHYDPNYRPAESKRHLRRPREEPKPRPQPQVMLNKPIYSTEEVRAIVSRLQKSKKNDNESSDNQENQREEVKIRDRHAYYTAQEVQEIIDKIQNDPARKQEQKESGGAVRPCAFRSRSGSLVRNVQSAGPKPTKDQVDFTTYRMTHDDPSKPKKSESEDKPPGGKKQKKVSANEMAAIVERLSCFESQRWPPESRPEKKEMHGGGWNNSTKIER